LPREIIYNYRSAGFWNLPWTHTLRILFPFLRFTDLTQQ
jgi:hypothetical protein